jgi:hypothetical protein
MEMLAGAPLLGDMLRGPLKKLVDEKTAVIRERARRGRIASIDPHHLLFMIWAMTQHYADFSVQITAFTGRTLDNPAFAKKARDNILELFCGLIPRNGKNAHARAATAAPSIPLGHKMTETTRRHGRTLTDTLHLAWRALLSRSVAAVSTAPSMMATA